jgi:Family of unknown function (DUF5763)
MDTRALSIDRLSPFRQTTVYVDSDDSVCNVTAGPYAVRCEEYEVHDHESAWIVYKCIWCHADDFEFYCKGRTQINKRCKKAGNYNGYCSTHSNQKSDN